MVLEMIRHHAQLNRLSVLISLPREQSDDADMGDPECDRRRPRESLGEERKTKRVRIKSLVAKKAMNGWRPKRNGCELTVVPDVICSLPTTLRADLS